MNCPNCKISIQTAATNCQLFIFSPENWIGKANFQFQVRKKEGILVCAETYSRWLEQIALPLPI